MGRPPRWREAVAVAALMTYPAILNLEEAGRVDSPDGRWAIWNVAWVAHALTTDPAGLYQTNIFHPYSDTLVFAEANLVAGLLAVPAYLATGSSFVAHNSVLLIAFMLSFIGMYALARSLTDSPAASIAPAIAFACCPYIFARVPHISLQLMGGLRCRFWPCIDWWTSERLDARSRWVECWPPRRWPQAITASSRD